ncbi:hypothetical protein M5K25_016988 [Dendrobium thyrsiflorum]|uniref:Uncharacterized protein n=1 Tax=Dendrobium thyrsiflorum TaxID=117978 RepID=A0ABD0ULP1_DENTH
MPEKLHGYGALRELEDTIVYPMLSSQLPNHCFTNWTAPRGKRIADWVLKKQSLPKNQKNVAKCGCDLIYANIELLGMFIYINCSR